MTKEQILAKLYQMKPDTIVSWCEKCDFTAIGNRRVDNGEWTNNCPAVARNGTVAQLIDYINGEAK